MAHGRENGPSRGLAVYGLLLELYPRAYLRRHREELLQNFRDLEQELPSKTALWCLIAKDLAISLKSQFVRTLVVQTTIRFAILSLVLVIVSRYGVQREQSAWALCVGYGPGWFAGWLGRSWRLKWSSASRGFAGSFSGQAAMLAGTITIVLATARLVADLPERLVLAFCYGVVLAWVSGWWGNYQTRRTLGAAHDGQAPPQP